MNNISDNDLDKLFREAAGKYQAPYDDEAWLTLNEKLDYKKDAFLYYKIMAGVVILFIVGAALVGYLSMRPANVNDRIAQENTLNQNMPFHELENNTSSQGHHQDQKNPPNNKNLNQAPGKSSSTSGLAMAPLASPKPGANPAAPAFVKGIGVDYSYVKNRNFLIPKDSTLRNSSSLSKEKIDRVGKRWSISLAFAPDLTSIGYFNFSRPGSNYGLKSEYSLNKKWSISAGIVYARKIYDNEEIQGYGYYGGSINTVYGDCRIIDLPLNLNYYVFRTGQHGFFLSAGSSSYIMLREKYDYSKIINGIEEAWSSEYRNENNHWFGMANFSIGYERMVNSNFSFQVEPFFKVPMTGIGEGKVELVSTGLSFNFRYHIK